MGEVCEIKTGPFGSLLHAEDYVDEGVPIVTTEHFKSGALPEDKREIPQVSEEDAKRLEQYRAKEGDILFSRVGSVDINAQVFAGQNGWLFSGRVLRARPNATAVSSAYLHYELETEEVKNSVINRAVGGTMASINTAILSHTPIAAPKEMAEQYQIGRYFANLDSLITLHQRMCSIFCFCAHGSRINFASILQGQLRILRYLRPMPKMRASPSALASGTTDIVVAAYWTVEGASPPTVSD